MFVHSSDGSNDCQDSGVEGIAARSNQDKHFFKRYVSL